MKTLKPADKDGKERMGVRILLVDDDADTRTAISSLLTGAIPDAIVDEASSAEEALDRALKRVDVGEPAYDLFLTDHHMGYMTGADLVARARGESLARSSILMSGDLDAEDAMRLIGNGDSFLAKPFAFPDLLAKLKAALAAGAPSRAG